MAQVFATVLSADGCVPVSEPIATGCCPPPLCGNDLCGTFCAFINLLPSGPMWDYWKKRATDYFTYVDIATCNPVVDPSCPTLIQHAIYVVLKLRDVIHNALYPALRESDPTTAIITLDHWLDRLQWEDCYNQHCRSVLLGELTPYEVWTECGPMFCPPDFPPELECALKHNVAIALTRANMGVIKNLCGLNWIIEPLGARLYPYEGPPVVKLPIVLPDAECDPYDCGNITLEICNSQDWIEGCPDGNVCETLIPTPKIQAWWEYGCDRPAGLPERVWPGVLSAECIVRSMLPPRCTNIIRRCC